MTETKRAGARKRKTNTTQHSALRARPLPARPSSFHNNIFHRHTIRSVFASPIYSILYLLLIIHLLPLLHIPRLVFLFVFFFSFYFRFFSYYFLYLLFVIPVFLSIFHLLPLLYIPRLSVTIFFHRQTVRKCLPSASFSLPHLLFPLPVTCYSCAFAYISPVTSAADPSSTVPVVFTFSINYSLYLLLFIHVFLPIFQLLPLSCFLAT